MSTGYLKIINGNIITPTGILKKGSLLIAGKKIIEVSNGKGFSDNWKECSVLDAKGLYVAPGCIDMHVHGGAGHDFLEATPEAFIAIAEAHAQYGTTAMYPTLAVAPSKLFYQVFNTFSQLQKLEWKGASLLGLHLEGNYINPKYKGAQDSRYIQLPDPEEYKLMLDSTDCIKRWSAAPELAGASDFARYATDRGVIVSLAHTGADYSVVEAGLEAGFVHVTHFYNAMQGVHKQREYKKEGTIESVYLLDNLTVEIISDGVHLPPPILRLVHKIKGVERTALVTDCCAAGAGASDVKCFDPRVIIEEEVAKLADRSALAGSIATADRLIRTMMKQAGIPLVDAVRMVSETPARIMKIDHQKGSLQKGKDADIILFDEDIHVQATLVEGKIVYMQPGIEL